MGKQPIESINRFLRDGQVQKAIEAFKSDVKNTLAYMFAGKPEFVRDGVITFFEKLVAIDNEFMVVMGPRRTTAEGKYEHPTYHIAFDNLNGRFFAGFTLKFVRNKHVTLVYPAPSDDYFDEDLGKLGYKVKHQSSGDYATVWIDEAMADDEYESMAKAAYCVKCHYLGTHPSKLDRVKIIKKPSESTEKNYLPTKSDCELALNALKGERKVSSATREDLFEWLEQHFQNKGVSMKDNWKLITERNLELWFS